MPAAPLADEQVVSSADNHGAEKAGAADNESSEGGEAGGGSSSLLWMGLAAGGLGLLALAGGGGGSGGGDGGGSGPPSPPPPVSDTVPPHITSAATAPAIAENSGAGQVVYTATATDAATITYSLKPVNDSAAFSIDASSGALILTGNPDFETKASYNFTVVATDAAQNSSEQAVSLAINNIVDETPPTVSDIALTSSIGAQNGILNAGDTVIVTVTLSENTVINNSGGTPSVELQIGGDRVEAGYVSGSGTTSLTFQYTIQPGDEDSNGISIPPNPIHRNGSSIADLAGNAADLGHVPVGNNASFVVDTTAPTLSSSTPADGGSDVPPNANVVLHFSENVHAGSGDIIISSSGGLDTRTIAVSDASQVSISGDQVTINPTLNLVFNTTYSVQIAGGAFIDDAGNAYAGISNTSTLNFETTPITLGPLGLAQASTDVSRTFQDPMSEAIDIRGVSNDAPGAAGAASLWSGAANLGSDDRVAVAGSGVHVSDPAAPENLRSLTEAAVAWQSSAEAGLADHSTVIDAEPMPGALHEGAHTNAVSLIDHLPLTTQGLV